MEEPMKKGRRQGGRTEQWERRKRGEWVQRDMANEGKVGRRGKIQGKGREGGWREVKFERVEIPSCKLGE